MSEKDRGQILSTLLQKETLNRHGKEQRGLRVGIKEKRRGRANSQTGVWKS